MVTTVMRYQCVHQFKILWPILVTYSINLVGDTNPVEIRLYPSDPFIIEPTETRSYCLVFASKTI